MYRFFSVTILLFIAACSGSKTSPATAVLTGSNAVVAEINGTQITDQELTVAANAQLKKIEGQIYQVKRSVLDHMVEQKLIEQAAQKAGLSTDDFVKKEVDDKVSAPTDAEMKTLFESRKGKTTQSFEELKPQIAAYLNRTRQAEAEQELTDKLRAEGKVTLKLEPPRVEIATDGQPSFGPEDAPITLVEVSDYQCPFCKRVQPSINQIMEEYKGKVRRVFIDFPLSFHADSPKAHEAAYCAGEQDKYFDMYHKIFENQTAIKLPDLKKYAQELKLNSKKFDECLDSSRHTAHVQKNVQVGADAGVSGTPAFFVNGIMLSGAQPYSAFKEVIESELALKK